MQAAAIGTVAKPLSKNEAIFTTILISNIYIPYTDLRKKFGVEGNFRNFECE